MARQGKSILDGFSGSVLNVTGYKSKGKSIMKSKSENVAKTQTQELILSKTKFHNVESIARLLLLDFIKPLWDKFTVNKSGYNAFIGSNINLFENSIPNPPGEFILSSGVIGKTIINRIFKDGATAVGCLWSETFMPKNAKDTDRAYLLLYNVSLNEWAIRKQPGSRRDDFLDGITNLGHWDIGNTVYCWLSFLSLDEKKVSETTYFEGPITIL